MGRYIARDLLNMTEEQLWQLPEAMHTVVFADREMEALSCDIINAVYMWYPLLQYPEVPIVSDYIDSTDFTGKTLLKLLKKVLWQGLFDFYQENIDPELLALMAIESSNRWYNGVTENCAADVSSLSILDVLEIMDNPEIAAANKEAEPTQYSIEEITYPRIAKALRDPEHMRANSIAMGIRCGTQKMEQVLQCFGPRGFPTDINSDIFPEPIMTGYAQGIWNLYDSMTESRSGTKSLLYNKELLRSTEYFNRKNQLIAQYVQRLHMGDCGGDYIEVPILQDLLKHMAGKYYLKDDGSVDWLRGNEKHLVGQTIKIRSVLGCKHPDPQGVCSRCYGRMAFSIPRGTNIGQVSAVQVGDQITSKVLSTKHTDSTSKVDRFQLHKIEAKYLRYGKKEETLYLRKEWAKHPMKIVIERHEAQNLADVLMLKDLSAYPPGNATNLTRMMVMVETVEGTVNEIMNVSLYNRKSSLSREMLEHIQKSRWKLDARDNVVIDLEGFDFANPFLVLPNKHVNMYEIMKRIQSFLHSGTDSETPRSGVDPLEYSGKTYLKNYRDPVDGLMVTASMLNEKLSVNIVHCEILVYAMMVRSSVQRDYRLPKPGISGVFEKYTRLMQGRSLAGAMAYEKQHEPLNNPSSFQNVERNDHPYDLVLLGGKLH